MSATHADLWCICNEKMNCFVVDFLLLLHLQMWIRWKNLWLLLPSITKPLFSAPERDQWTSERLFIIWSLKVLSYFPPLSLTFTAFLSCSCHECSWCEPPVPLPPHSWRTSNWGVKGAICYLLKHTTAITGVFTPRVHVSVNYFC